jgi:hypothetical protein
MDMRLNAMKLRNSTGSKKRTISLYQLLVTSCEAHEIWPFLAIPLILVASLFWHWGDGGVRAAGVAAQVVEANRRAPSIAQAAPVTPVPLRQLERMGAVSGQFCDPSVAGEQECKVDPGGALLLRGDGKPEPAPFAAEGNVILDNIDAHSALGADRLLPHEIQSTPSDSATESVAQENAASAATWVIPSPLPQSNRLYAVWGVDANNIWATGVNGTILRWDGSAWITQASGVTYTLVGIWGVDPNHVWVVGDNGVILFWNGSAWNKQQEGTGYNLQRI